MQNAYVIQGFRTPVTKAGKGGLKGMRSDDLAVSVIEYLMSHVPDIDPALVDDCIVGCANPEGEQGLQIGRLISMRALGESVPGMTVNRYCASGLEAIAIASAKIRAGFGHIYIAGGTESMSMIPMTGYKFAPNYETAKDHPDSIIGMGLTAEAVAKKYGISRQQQDEFALRSHQLAAKAQEYGSFSNEIVPIEVEEVYIENDERKTRKFTVTEDDGIRRDTSLEALGSLKPAFAIDGSVTAGNSSQMSDGAAFVLVVSDEVVNKYNLKPFAKLIACSVAGVDPLYMGMGPVAAIPKALKMANLSMNDIQVTELNEAFASQACAVINELRMDIRTVNVNGGAIALGHPLGCTGAKLSIQVINEAIRRGEKYAMVSACVGGGQGIAGIYEILYHK